MTRLYGPRSLPGWSLTGSGVLLGLVILTLIPQRVSAGDCYARPRTYYAPSYGYSYYTPTYSYQAPTYYAPAPCETKVKYYPYPTTPDYYSSVGDYYRDKLLVDALAGRTAEVLKQQAADQEKERKLRLLEEEVSVLRQRLLYGPQQQPPQPQPGNNPPPPYEPTPPQDAGAQRPPREKSPPPVPRQETPKEAPKAPPKKTSALHPTPDKLKAIVQASCIRCHGNTNATAGAGIDLRDLDAVDGETRRAAAQAVEDGFMPKGGKNLNDTEYQEFRAWATGRRAQVAQK